VRALNCYLNALQMLLNICRQERFLPFQAYGENGSLIYGQS